MASRAALAALLLVGCGNTQDELDSTVAVVQREIAASFWRRGVVTKDTVSVTIGIGRIPGSVDGVEIGSGGDALIVVEGAEANVIAHELGHAMGLSHVDEPWIIMHETAPALSTRDAADQLAELCMTTRCRAIVLP